MAPVKVRAARPEDSREIGHAHSEAWRVGFSGLFDSGWLRAAVDDRKVGEVFALYVHPDHWGTGAAQLITRHAIDQLRAGGFQRIALRAPSGASRARAFYERNGWAFTDRTAERDFGDGRLTKLVEYALST